MISYFIKFTDLVCIYAVTEIQAGPETVGASFYELQSDAGVDRRLPYAFLCLSVFVKDHKTYVCYPSLVRIKCLYIIMAFLEPYAVFVHHLVLLTSCA